MTGHIIQLLLASTPVKNKVGKNAANDKWKVYPLVLPQTEKPPFIIVKTTSRPPVYCKDGEPSAWNPTTAVDVYTVNYEDCIELSELVEAALNRKRITYGDTTVHDVRYNDRSEGWLNFDGVGLCVRTLTFEGDESTAT